jgi:hypothetical protein
MLKTLAAFLVLSNATLAGAEEFPWCVEVDVFTKNCAFASRDECVAVAKNVSSPATGTGRCIANPNYVAPAATKPAKASAKTPTKPR